MIWPGVWRRRPASKGRAGSSVIHKGPRHREREERGRRSTSSALFAFSAMNPLGAFLGLRLRLRLWLWLRLDAALYSRRTLHILAKFLARAGKNRPDAVDGN